MGRGKVLIALLGCLILLGPVGETAMAVSTSDFIKEIIELQIKTNQADQEILYRQGDKKADIKVIKNQLDKMNFDIEINNDYDEKMVVLLKAYVEKYHLGKEGTVLSRKVVQHIDYNYRQRALTNPKAKDLLVLVNKRYFLASDYIPFGMVTPKVPLVNGGVKMLPEAAKALEEMFSAAEKEKILLYGRSGYRSYQTQRDIFQRHVRNSGLEKANQFSAKPGQSEHQTGLAIDITSKSVSKQLTQKFAESKEGKWVAQNAHLYGFIIRFPKGKEGITGYQYEPWHIRYVGLEAATAIFDKEITLEEYLNKSGEPQ